MTRLSSLLTLVLGTSMLVTLIGAQLQIGDSDQWWGDDITTKKPAATTTKASNVRAATNLQPDYCGLLNETGPCKALVSRYFFNVFTQKCEQFIWGGCRGNANNFASLANCTATCAPRTGGRTFAPPITTTLPPVPTNLPAECYARSDAGTGSDMVIRYYYNTDRRVLQCQAFTWTGQGGNDNNFETFDGCAGYCKPSDDEVRGLPVSDCDSDCTIGRCDELKKTADNYTLISSYLQIYLGLQAQCSGTIDSVSFLDMSPLTKAGTYKQFYISIWDINGLSSIDSRTQRVLVDLATVELTLVKIIPMRSTAGSFGWQKVSLTSQNIQIVAGQYIGIHLPNLMTLGPNCTIPYTGMPNAMPAIAINTDHAYLSKVGVLPQVVPLFTSNLFNYQIDMRRPALVVQIKSASGSDSTVF